MQCLIKNTIRITFPDSQKGVFQRSSTEKNTFSKTTLTRHTAKWAPLSNSDHFVWTIQIIPLVFDKNNYIILLIKIIT